MDGSNILIVRMTRGSNGESGHAQDTLLGTVYETPDGPRWERVTELAGQVRPWAQYEEDA
jgi:hypothetical protein